MTPPTPSAGQSGQASVELVALLPLLAVCLLACWQLVLVGHTGWSAHAAARAAARAHAVGGDERAAARSSLPSSLDDHLTIEEPDDEDRIPVRLRVPSILPGVELGTITARAGFAPQS